MDKVSVLGNGYVVLLDSMGSDLDIVNAARKSFASESEKFTDKDRKLLKYLWENKHTSPFEMAEFKFGVKAPLFVVRQWQRHRTWSYNEVSRRYTSEDLDFHIPESFRLQSKDNKQSSEGYISDCEDIEDGFLMAMRVCFAAYNKAINDGVCREQARMILPQNMMVEMVAKTDLHNLIHFLKLRNHEHAQWEIQEYARAIESLITPIVPETMALYRGSNG